MSLIFGSGPEMGAWVYILGCGDGSYYVGNTRRTVEERLAEHVSGTFRGYTAYRQPVTVAISSS